MASAGQSLPGGSVCCTPTRDGVRERKGRAGTHQCWVSWSTSPGPPCLLWQIHRCRNPGAPAPQGLHASSSLALHPEKAEAGWVGRAAGGGGQGSAVWSAGRQHKAQISFPGSVHVGAGAPARRSGIILLPSPVDVLEEGHGEGHAQNLKDMGKGP